MILDTNAVSAVLNDDQDAARLRLPSRYLAIPVIVVAEYLFGLRSSTRRTELTTSLNELIDETDLLLPDRATADCYADVRHDLKRRGTPISPNDLWIAALAVQHDLPILSRDAHFDAIDGVRRIGW